ncbi:MAG TPA: cupredoxin family copper-binding protein [Burkholderiales bacterium]|jgi:plastocyanin
MKSAARVSLLVMLLVGSLGAHAAGKTHAVRIENFKFVPERLEVAKGDTIVWTNMDILPHSVTAEQAKIESGVLQTGKSFKLVARKPGEIDYICRLHPVMKGVVVVK